MFVFISSEYDIQKVIYIYIYIYILSGTEASMETLSQHSGGPWCWIALCACAY